MHRLIDLFAVLAIAVVVLLPKASVEARPALDGETVEMDRVAELQDDLARAPDEPESARRYAEELLALGRADWALQTLARFQERGAPGVHLVAATAHAERLEPAQSVADCKRFEEACAKVACSDGERTKEELLRAAMQSLADQNVDAAKDPMRAKELVYKALHPTRYNLIHVSAPAAAPKPPAK